MTRLELAICVFASIAPALLITEYFTGASFPFLVFAVPVVIYLGLFCKLLVDEIKGELNDKA
jgi:hypothetical protein